MIEIMTKKQIYFLGDGLSYFADVVNSLYDFSVKYFLL